MSAHSSLQTVHRLGSYVAASAVLVLILLVVAACGEGTDEGAGGDSLAVGVPPMADTTMEEETSTRESIFDILQDDARFSTFASLLDSAGLAMTLSGPGPYTVLAPTNEAIAASESNPQNLLDDENKDRLRDILLHHMFNGERMASELSSSSIRTLAGGDLQVTGSGDSLRVGDVRFVETDVDAANGVVHVIEHVLMPDTNDGTL